MFYSLFSLLTIGYYNIIMSFKIAIKQKTDQQLLQLFDNDAFSDFTVITTHQQLHLTLAYLVIDSEYFARIPQGVKSVDLSTINQVYLINVLRSLYGDELQASSISELSQIFNVVSFLEIKQYVFLMEKAIVKLHSQCGSISSLLSIQLLEFSMKNDIAKELILQLHIENELNSLQSMRNYLQLAKLSKEHLNYLLLQFLSRLGEKGYDIINRILENYFNRKAYRASQYFQNHNLSPLKAVWEHFHHKIPFLNQSIALSKTYPETLRASDRKTSIKLKMTRLNSLPNINEQPLEYDPKLLKSEKIDQERLLDIKIAALQRQKKEKDKKIGQLRKQMLELRALNELKSQNQQDSYIQDMSLFQQVARSRKLRQKLLQKEHSVNHCQQGFQLKKLSSQKQVKSNLQFM